MKKRILFCKLMILAIGMTSLPFSKAQISTAQNSTMRISSYDDDPFVEDSILERMDSSRFNLGEAGRPILSNDRVYIKDEPVIYREDSATGEYIAFALNPFPQPTANAQGNFKFQDEERFPLHRVARDSNGKIILNENGLQVWLPQDIHRGMTTAFEAANAVKDAGESWSGRDLVWGDENDILTINSHATIDFNAFFSPSEKGLFFGVVPYRLPGQNEVKIFEMATSWEVAAHESGHALHAAIKPNIVLSDQGFRTWSESFADQVAMWTGLRDKDRARALLAKVNGDLLQSNSLTRIGEVLASLIGEGTGIRDAFHDKKVSNTSTEVHERSEVLTGATYRFFLALFGELKSGRQTTERDALMEAAEIMGTFTTLAADYTPENRMTLEDVAKAYLKVDKEFYGGRHYAMLVDEFIRREIFDADSAAEWLAHETAVPNLRLPGGSSERRVERMLLANLDKLGIGPDFGLKLQSVIRGSRFGQTIVRVQLTEGRGSGAVPLDNHGILTFRADGTLADYHAPLSPQRAGLEVSLMKVEREMVALIEQAKQFRLDRRGAPLSIVRRPNGQLTVEARVMRAEGIYCWVEAFTLENPGGERREVITPTVPRKIRGYQPSGAQILTADDLN